MVRSVIRSMTHGYIVSSFDLLSYNPLIWLDMTDTDTISSAANLVSQIDDKSGNDNHVIQATGSLQVETGHTINSLNAIMTSGEKRMALASSVSAVQFFAAIELTDTTGAAAAIIGAEVDGSPEAGFTVETSPGAPSSGTVSQASDGYEDTVTNTWNDEYATENVCIIGYSPFLPAERGTAVAKINNIAIVPGQTVTTADLTWACDWALYGAFKGFIFRIYAVADPDAADVGSGNLPTAQTLTTAYVEVDTRTWTGYQTTTYWVPGAEVIDISPVIQELVDHANWTSGDSAQLIFQVESYPTGNAGVSFNSTESAGTLLSLDYVAASSSTDSIVSFNGSGSGFGYYAIDGANYGVIATTDTATSVGVLTGKHVVSGYFTVDGAVNATAQNINLETFFGRAGLVIPEEAKISEVIWFSSVLSYDDKHAIEDWLATKYGVTLVPGAGEGTGGGDGDTTAPVITRKTHSQEVFVTQGNTLSVTYVSDIPCYWEVKAGTQFTEVLSADGLEITLSWSVPANQPGDSDYIGVVAWRYGDDTTEVYDEMYDIYHVGKVAGDIKTLGVGTAYTTLQAGIEQTANSGDTLIIEDGLYNAATDTLMVGYYPGGVNYDTPNGVTTGSDTVNVLGADGVTVTGTEDIVVIDKFTTIMSRTPLGAVVDRQYKLNSSRLLGNYRAGPYDGFRTTHGISVKGVAFRNLVDSPATHRADECHYKWCSMVQDTTSTDFAVEYPLDDPEYQDGSFMGAHSSARRSTFEGVSAIGNNRFGFLAGRTAPEDENASKYCSIKQAIVTNACSSGWNDSLCQAFTGYGSRHYEFLNCISIDSQLFKDGVGTEESISGPMTPNYAFICTNNASDDHYFEGVASINDLRGGIRMNVAANAIYSDIKNAIFWNRDGSSSIDISLEYVERMNLDNITMGRNTDWFANVGSMVAVDDNTVNHNNILIVYPRWDSVTIDEVIDGSAEVGVDDNFVFIPTGETPAAGYLANLNTYYEIDAANVISSGAQYLTRPEPGSAIEGYGIGCMDWFAWMGDSTIAYQDGAPTRHDGANYKNWMSRLPMLQFRSERATYSCTRVATEYTGDVGAFAAGVNIIDYINAIGTSPANPVNTPFIEDIYVYLNASNNPVLCWRPLCPAYRLFVSEICIYIDGVETITGLDRSVFFYELTGLSSGVKSLRVVVKDSVTGDSGLSRAVPVTVP